MKKMLIHVAKVIRSKNAGPFELTLDIILKNKKVFNHFKKNQIITKKKIANLYKVNPNDIQDVIYFDPSNAIKITMKRPLPSGAPGDSDIYGAQQHAPLLTMKY